MKNTTLFILRKYTLVSLIFFLLTSCGKEYNTEFLINNESQRTVSIFLLRSGKTKIDTNIINSKKKLIILVKTGDDKTTSDYMNGLEKVPVDSLKVTDLNGKGMVCDEQQLNCWQKFIPDKKDGFGSFILRIREDSFEQ